MNERSQLILALTKVNELFVILKHTEYEKHLYDKLHSIKIEIERQLNNSKDDFEKTIGG